VLARENDVPFFVAAPTSTFDMGILSGDQIPIEHRSAADVTHVFGVPIAPEGIAAANPIFDITPMRYISAIVTEQGIIRPTQERTPLFQAKATQYYSCFISYASADQRFVDRLHADLEARGVRCWFAPRDVRGARSFTSRLGTLLATLTECCLCCLSTA
jgi:hypothetical protein